MTDWKEELRKCKEDEAYFFENYCLIDGKKPGKYTVERFKKYLEDNKVVRKLYRTRNGYKYLEFARESPIRPEEAFPQSNFED